MNSTINFEGKDQKVVSYKEFEQILNSVGMQWYGIKNWIFLLLKLLNKKY